MDYCDLIGSASRSCPSVERLCTAVNTLSTSMNALRASICKKSFVVKGHDRERVLREKHVNGGKGMGSAFGLGVPWRTAKKTSSLMVSSFNASQRFSRTSWSVDGCRTLLLSRRDPIGVSV